jgi:ActR/RegA family two-component response regulator
MSRLKLLIVEDDSAHVETWKRQIDRNNALNNFNYVADYAASYERAIELIEFNKYDAAIVDIRLQDPSGISDATTGGNDVRDLLLQSEIVLIAHVTGEPTAVDFGTSNYKELVRVFTKADPSDSEQSVHDAVLEWLEEKSKIVLTMKKVKSNIASKMAGLFYSSIWPRWDSWQAATEEGGEFVPSSITRHITSHLYATFLEEDGGKVHPEEWYFQPPATNRFHTGDLVFYDDDYYVLVTPRCDLERLNDGDRLLFAKMDVADRWLDDKKKVDDKVSGLTSSLSSANKEKKAKIKKDIDKAYASFRKNYYGHKDGKFNLHFLPEVNQFAGGVHGPFFVDFGNIHTVVVGTDEANSMLDKKIAALSPEFLPNLVQRLGTFISRIGSPDYSHFS